MNHDPIPSMMIPETVSSTTVDAQSNEIVKIEYDPSNSVLSFIIWIGTYLVYFSYLAWAFLPDSVLHPLGITYYPSRYYALALPAYVIILLLTTVLMYVGWNLANTNDPDDFATIKDRHDDGRQVVTKIIPARYVKCGNSEGIPDFGDIDPVEMSKLLADIPLR